MTVLVKEWLLVLCGAADPLRDCDKLVVSFESLCDRVAVAVLVPESVGLSVMLGPECVPVTEGVVVFSRLADWLSVRLGVKRPLGVLGDLLPLTECPEAEKLLVADKDHSSLRLRDPERDRDGVILIEVSSDGDFVSLMLREGPLSDSVRGVELRLGSVLVTVLW